MIIVYTDSIIVPTDLSTKHRPIQDSFDLQELHNQYIDKCNASHNYLQSDYCADIIFCIKKCVSYISINLSRTLIVCAKRIGIEVFTKD